MARAIKTRSPYTIDKVVIFSIGMIFLVSCFAGCGKKTVNDRGGEKKMAAKTIEEVLEENTDKWMSIPGVIGTAIGEQKGESCIIVLVIEKTSELTEKIPSTIEGFPVVIKQTGEIRALDQR